MTTAPRPPTRPPSASAPIRLLAERPRSITGPPPAGPPRGSPWLRRWLGGLLAGYVALRAVILGGVCLAGFVVVTAVAGAWVAGAAARVLLGVAVVLVLPLVAGWRLRAHVRARVAGAHRRGGALVVVGWNAALLALLCLGFSDVVGRAVRRRGDWFLGEVDGWLPRRYRRAMAAAGRWMERFDVPPEARPLLAEAAVPQPQPRPVGREPALPGDPPPGPAPASWYYPLGARIVPAHAACRFGAPRGGRQPAECELGHCGVDLGQARGTPVYAVHDGVVRSVVREDTGRGGGRLVWLAHKDGQLVTQYLHLHEVRSDLRVGTVVRGGELIGVVGSSGGARGPHLHFGLAVRQGPGLRYVDPEPLLQHWLLPIHSSRKSESWSTGRLAIRGRARSLVTNEVQPPASAAESCSASGVRAWVATRSWAAGPRPRATAGRRRRRVLESKRR